MREDVKRALLPMEEAVRQGMPFAERLALDPLTKAKQETLCPPTEARRAVAEIPGPPPGYRQPAKWDQLWPFREEPHKILLATATGWEPIDRVILVDTVKEVREVNELGHPIWDAKRGKWKTKQVPWTAVKPGVVWFHGSRLEELKLTSLRIPESGKREARHG